MNIEQQKILRGGEVRVMNSPVQKRQKSHRAILIGVFSIVFFFVPNSFFGLGDTVWGWLKNACLLATFLMYVPEIPHFFRGRNAGIRIALLTFCIVKVLSVIVNADYVSSLAVNAVIDGELVSLDTNISAKYVVYTSLMLLIFSIAAEHISRTGNSALLLKVLTLLMALLVIVCNVDVLSQIDVKGDVKYMFMDKFKVCYLNLFLCVLYHFQNPSLKGSCKFVMLTLLSMLVAISLLTKCTTLLMCSLLYAYLVFVSSNGGCRFFYKTGTLLMSFLIFDVLFFFFSGWLLKFPLIQTIVVDFLHEDLTLTGRLGIYAELKQTFLERPLLGYGEGSSFVICNYFANAPDTQNGLAEILLTNGILGCVAFLLLMVAVIKCASRLGFKAYPIVIFIYLMIVISMVEIPFGNEFIFFVILILLKSNTVYKWAK